MIFYRVFRVDRAKAAARKVSRRIQRAKASSTEACNIGHRSNQRTSYGEFKSAVYRVPDGVGHYAVEKPIRRLLNCSCSPSAQLFSMRTNGLDLKLRGWPRQRGLYTAAGLHPEIFCNRARRENAFFLPFFLRSIAPREIRRLRAPSDHAGSHLMKDNVTYSLNRADGFIKPPLRTVSPLLISSYHLERDCSLGSRESSREVSV